LVKLLQLGCLLTASAWWKKITGIKLPDIGDSVLDYTQEVLDPRHQVAGLKPGGFGCIYFDYVVMTTFDWLSKPRGRARDQLSLTNSLPGIERVQYSLVFRVRAVLS